LESLVLGMSLQKLKDPYIIVTDIFPNTSVNISEFFLKKSLTLPRFLRKLVQVASELLGSNPLEDFWGRFSLRVSTVGHRSHDPCFNVFLMGARVMTFVAHCTSPHYFRKRPINNDRTSKRENLPDKIPDFFLIFWVYDFFY